MAIGATQAEVADQTPQVCPDCAAPAQGRYCVDCGQEIHVHRTLYHLGHELLHGVMHFDGRIWRTLPLLFVNPGRLTREWIMGRRTRYVSPLALFLCTLFIMFMALSFAPPPTQVQVNLPDQIAIEKARLTEVQAELTAAMAQLDATLEGQAAGEATKETLAAQQKVDRAEARVAQLEQEAAEGRKDGLKPGSWQAQLVDMDLDTSGQTDGLTAMVAKKLKNPDLAIYKLQQTTYKFAFLLVPLSIPFMALIFLWGRRFTLYDHGVFVLYSLTFMAMLLMVVAILVSLLPSLSTSISGLAMALVPVHIFAQLKGTYSLSPWGALWRTLVVSVFCVMVMTFFIIAILYLGLGH